MTIGNPCLKIGINMSDNEKAATAPEAPSPEVKEPVQPQTPPRRGETFKGAGVQKTKGVS